MLITKEIVKEKPVETFVEASMIDHRILCEIVGRLQSRSDIYEVKTVIDGLEKYINHKENIIKVLTENNPSNC